MDLCLNDNIVNKILRNIILFKIWIDLMKLVKDDYSY